MAIGVVGIGAVIVLVAVAAAVGVLVFGRRANDDSPGGGGAVLLLLLAGGVAVILLVVGGVAFFALRGARQAENIARMEAESARALAAERAATAQREQVDLLNVDLSRITAREAERLDGRTVLVTYDLLDNDERRGAFTVYSNVGPEDGVERAVYVPRGMKVERKGIAVGTLRFVRVPPMTGADGTTFAEYVEVRVVLE
jgi:hypothetical protein